MARDATALTGQVVAGWAVGERLGQGAMGAVYRAQRVDRPEQLAALKVLQPFLAGDAEGRTRFLREAKSLSLLTGDHCCRCLGSGEDDGLAWLAMELVPGQSLDKVLKVRGRLSAAEAADWTRQLLLGLAAAHEAGVYHRDVKPANVIVTEDSTIKLVDFGLARRRDESMQLTVQGVLLGTPHYMSPEQCAGRPLDGRSDLYSAGATLFHLVTGRTPFSGPSLPSILKKHLDERPPALQTFAPDAPRGLDAVVSRLMRKAPADRFQTAREAAAALDAVLGRLRRASAPKAAPARPTRPPAAASGPSPPAAAASVSPARTTTGARSAAGFLDARRLLERDPAAAGEAFERLGLRAEAADAFEAAGKLVRAGELRQALGELERAGDLFARAGDPARAAAVLARAGSAEDAAGALERAGRPEEAARHLAERAAELEAQRAREQRPTRLARIDADLARLVERARALFQAAGLPIEGARLLERIGRLRDAADLYLEAGDRVAAAAALVGAGDRARAIELHERAGDRVAAARLRAEALQKAGDLSGAASELERGGDVGGAAKLLEDGGDLARAAELWDRAGERLRGAELLARAGQPARAAERYEALGRFGDAARCYAAAGDRQGEARALARGRPARAGRPTTKPAAAAAARPVAKPTPAQPAPAKPAAEDPRAWLGRTIDRYRVVSVLGEGAYAHVLRAEHVHLERPVALKVLKATWAAREDVAARFLREAKLVSSIDHAGVVKVYDFGQAAGTSYMALELVEGRSLRQVVRERGRLPLAEARGLTVGVLEAVHAAHRKGVVHRDLKPENVVVDAVEGRPRVLDFGMARVFWGASEGAAEFAGTPSYASPEASARREVDARADQYAVGLILYELLTGALPFRSETAGGWLLQHMSTPPAAPSTLVPLPPGWDAVALRALAKRPEERFTDAAAFARALEALPV